MQLGEPGLYQVWSMAEEVPTQRGILVGDAMDASIAKALRAYRDTYPGKSEDIEKSYSVN
jgi:hypothetical protein